MIRGRAWLALLGTIGAYLSGCATYVEPPSSPTASSALPSSTTGTPSAAPRFAPSVPSPKDARGIGECDLLTPGQIGDLGLAADTADPGVSGAARVCTWAYRDRRNTAGLQIATERTIPGLDGIYIQRSGFAVFEPVTVSGHPGFHADQVPGDGCSLYIAIADHQLMTVSANLRGEPLPDPCAPSRRMAEMILSNLPPLAD